VALVSVVLANVHHSVHHIKSSILYLKLIYAFNFILREDDSFFETSDLGTLSVIFSAFRIRHAQLPEIYSDMASLSSSSIAVFVQSGR
jgi:hypothetical protein